MTLEKAAVANVEKGSEAHKAGDKPPANTAIVNGKDNELSQKQVIQNAIKSFKLTGPGQKSFSLRMEDGSEQKDSRKIAGERSETIASSGGAARQAELSERIQPANVIKQGADTLHQGQHFVQKEASDGQHLVQGIVKFGADALHYMQDGAAKEFEKTDTARVLRSALPLFRHIEENASHTPNGKAVNGLDECS